MDDEQKTKEELREESFNEIRKDLARQSEEQAIRDQNRSGTGKFFRDPLGSIFPKIGEKNKERQQKRLDRLGNVAEKVNPIARVAEDILIDEFTPDETGVSPYRTKSRENKEERDIFDQRLLDAGSREERREILKEGIQSNKELLKGAGELLKSIPQEAVKLGVLGVSEGVALGQRSVDSIKGVPSEERLTQSEQAQLNADAIYRSQESSKVADFFLPDRPSESFTSISKSAEEASSLGEELGLGTFGKVTLAVGSVGARYAIDVSGTGSLLKAPLSVLKSPLKVIARKAALEVALREGTQESADKFIKSNFGNLPEELQKELAGELKNSKGAKDFESRVTKISGRIQSELESTLSKRDLESAVAQSELAAREAAEVSPNSRFDEVLEDTRTEYKAKQQDEAAQELFDTKRGIADELDKEKILQKELAEKKKKSKEIKDATKKANKELDELKQKQKLAAKGAKDKANQQALAEKNTEIKALKRQANDIENELIQAERAIQENIENIEKYRNKLTTDKDIEISAFARNEAEKLGEKKVLREAIRAQQNYIDDALVRMNNGDITPETFESIATQTREAISDLENKLDSIKVSSSAFYTTVAARNTRNSAISLAEKKRSRIFGFNNQPKEVIKDGIEFSIFRRKFKIGGDGSFLESVNNPTNINTSIENLQRSEPVITDRTNIAAKLGLFDSKVTNTVNRYEQTQKRLGDAITRTYGKDAKAVTADLEQYLRMKHALEIVAEYGDEALTLDKKAAEKFIKYIETKVETKYVDDIDTIKNIKSEFPEGLFLEENEDLINISRKYLSDVGIQETDIKLVDKVDDKIGREIADAYDDMPDLPEDPKVQQAYQDMAEETIAQYRKLEDAGYKIEPWESDGQPYNNTQEMIDDVKNNKHLYYFKTDVGSSFKGDNPLTKKSGVIINGEDIVVNDVFRAVHDIFGHAKIGNKFDDIGGEFGDVGEENAWRIHSAMYSPNARRAMTTETRGQNSWVNYSKDFGANNIEQGPTGDIKFPDQKANLLPDKYVFEQDIISSDSASTIPLDKKAAENSIKYVETKYVDDPVFNNALETILNINKTQLANAKTAGRISPELYLELTEKYPFYVPFYNKRGDVLFNDPSQFTRVSSGIKKFTDKNEIVENVIDSTFTKAIQSAREDAINDARRTFGNFINESTQNAVVKQTDANSDLLFNVRKLPENYKPKSNELTYWDEGNQYVITAPNKYIAPFGKEPKNHGWLMTQYLDKSRGVQNFLSKMMTIGSPTFQAKSFVRDGLETLNNAAAAMDEVGNGILITRSESVNAVKGLADYEAGLKTENARYVDEYLNEAGVISSGRSQLYEYGGGSKLSEVVNSGGTPTRTQIWDAIKDTTRKIETNARLSTFIYARKKGYSVLEAGAIAQEAGVNFTKRGWLTDMAQPLYLFFNAAVQGNAAVLRSWRQNPVMLAKAHAALGLAVGTQDTVNTIVSGNENWKECVPDYVRAQNLVFVVDSGQQGTCNMTYIKIPIPFIMAGQKRLMEGSIDYARGNVDATKAIGDAVKLSAESVLPLGGTSIEQLENLDTDHWWKSILLSASPDYLDPAVQNVLNQDTWGNEVFKTEKVFGVDEFGRPTEDKEIVTPEDFGDDDTREALSALLSKMFVGKDGKPNRFTSPEGVMNLLQGWAFLGDINNGIRTFDEFKNKAKDGDPVDLDNLFVARSFLGSSTDDDKDIPFSKGEDIERLVSSADNLEEAKVIVAEGIVKGAAITDAVKEELGFRTIDTNMGDSANGSLLASTWVTPTDDKDFEAYREKGLIDMFEAHKEDPESFEGRSYENLIKHIASWDEVDEMSDVDIYMYFLSNGVDIDLTSTGKVPTSLKDDLKERRYAKKRIKYPKTEILYNNLKTFKDQLEEPQNKTQKDEFYTDVIKLRKAELLDDRLADKLISSYNTKVLKKNKEYFEELLTTGADINEMRTDIRLNYNDDDLEEWFELELQKWGYIN